VRGQDRKAGRARRKDKEEKREGNTYTLVPWSTNERPKIY
jgi:hypothetical protein